MSLLSQKTHFICIDSNEKIAVSDDGAHIFEVPCMNMQTSRVGISSIEFTLSQQTIEADWNRVYFSEGVRIYHDFRSIKIEESCIKCDHTNTISLNFPVHLNPITLIKVVGSFTLVGKLEAVIDDEFEYVEITTLHPHGLETIIQSSPGLPKWRSEYKNGNGSDLNETPTDFNATVIGNTWLSKAMVGPYLLLCDHSTEQGKSHMFYVRIHRDDDGCNVDDTTAEGYLHFPVIPSPKYVAKLVEHALNSAVTSLLCYKVDFDEVKGRMRIDATTRLPVDLQSVTCSNICTCKHGLRASFSGDKLSVSMGIHGLSLDCIRHSHNAGELNVSLTTNVENVVGIPAPERIRHMLNIGSGVTQLSIPGEGMLSSQKQTLHSDTPIHYNSFIRANNCQSDVTLNTTHTASTSATSSSYILGIGSFSLDPGWYSPVGRCNALGQPRCLAAELTRRWNPLHFSERHSKTLPDGWITPYFLPFTDNTGFHHTTSIPIYAGNYTIKQITDYLSLMMTQNIGNPLAKVSVIYDNNRFKFSCYSSYSTHKTNYDNIKYAGGTRCAPTQFGTTPAYFTLDMHSAYAVSLNPERLGLQSICYNGSVNYQSTDEVMIPSPHGNDGEMLATYHVQRVEHQRRFRFVCNQKPAVICGIECTCSEQGVVQLYSMHRDIQNCKDETCLIYPYSCGYTPNTIVHFTIDVGLEVRLPHRRLKTSNSLWSPGTIETRASEDHDNINTDTQHANLRGYGVVVGGNKCSMCRVSSPETFRKDGCDCPWTLKLKVPNTLQKWISKFIASQKSSNKLVCMYLTPAERAYPSIHFYDKSDLPNCIPRRVLGFPDSIMDPLVQLWSANCDYPLLSKVHHVLDHHDYILLYLISMGTDTRENGLQHHNVKTGMTFPFAKIIVSPQLREGGVRFEIVTPCTVRYGRLALKFTNPDGSLYHLHNGKYSLTLTFITTIC